MSDWILKPLLLLGGFVTLLLYNDWRRSKLVNPNGLPLPPGPKPLPLIGNIRDMPAFHEWLTYTKWSKVYGDVFHVKVLGSHIIILNSRQATVDLFEKRSSHYSDRPRMPMLNELMSWDWAFPFMNYGPWWRRHRRAFHQHFTAAASQTYKHVQTEEARRMLQRLIETPHDFKEHIQLLAAAIVMRVAYGIQVLDSGDKYITAAEGAIYSLAQVAVPGSFLVDIIPMLKYVPGWLPGAGFQLKAQEWRKLVLDFINNPFNAVKNELASGTGRPSMLASLLENIKGSENPDEEEQIARNTTAVAYVAGVDTTSSTLNAFFFAMLLHPEVQRQAQAELDAVIGPDRLPEFSDQPSLPYVEAVVKETLRWLPVVPMSIPHCVRSDDVYNGYHIPKGSIVMGNSWGILRDEKLYTEPNKFIPERFLKDGKLNPDVPDPEEVAAFGYGRRICPGRHMASNSLFITFASVLAAFNIKQERDLSGNLVEINREMATGLASYPKSFQCVIKPRSVRTGAIIRQSMEDNE